MYKLLPVTRTNIEVASFDIQRIKNPEICGKEYQEGEMKGDYNVREYVLHRDNHTCQNPACKNRDKDAILRTHHIDYQSNGGTERPENMITLCTKCHTSENHKGFLKTWKPKTRGFKPETFMSTVRWMVVNELRKKYENIHHCYGYQTKTQRIALKLEKSHINDAFCIAGGTDQKRVQSIVIQQKHRNNRSLGQQRNGFAPCSRTKRHSTQPLDMVWYKGKMYYISGSHNKGTRVLLGKKSVAVSKLEKIYHTNSLVWKVA